MAKKAWKSKTEIANTVIVGLTIIEMALSKSLIPISPQIQLLALGIINIVLRFMTNEPITIKPGDATK